MKFRFAHNNFNVKEMERSLQFYQKALGLKETRRINAPDGDWKRPYDLGDNEFHLAMRVDDFEAAHTLHEEMGCICFENPDMGIYFIADPDGYWIEIIP